MRLGRLRWVNLGRKRTLEQPKGSPEGHKGGPRVCQGCPREAQRHPKTLKIDPGGVKLRQILIKFCEKKIQKAFQMLLESKTRNLDFDDPFMLLNCF